MNGEADFLWWAALRHGGCLIAPSRLGEFFEQSLEPLPRHLADQLRRELTSFQHATGGDLGSLLDTVLEQVLGLATSQWAKAQAVETAWSVRTAAGENIKPRRLWREPNGGLLPVFTSEETRLGVGRSRRDVARVNEWLRQKPDAKIALLTNGNQWRLIHAGADYDAWCEWDTTLWFEEGEPGLQVVALRSLLGIKALTPESAGKPAPLVAAILASRRGQAELSSALGERVRQAVELLITESRPVLETLEADKEHPVSRRHVYVAAVRLVMRCVVVLFAEARDLLPRNHPIYHNSYGLQGLQEQLERFGGDRGHRQLRQRLSGWPRILALFRLIYHGSEHEALPVLRYGGGLFTPGDANSSDPVLRALAAFESSRNDINDAAIAQLLDYLTRTLASIRVGRAASIVATPVDFSQLDTEYIGILYEGLLDYELRKADRVPLLFLNLGDQPVLPLDRLEAMADDALNNLVKKAAKAVKASEGDDEEDSEDEEQEESDDAPAKAEVPSPELQPAVLHDEASDEHRQLRDRAVGWARRAAQAGSLVTRPRGKATADKQREFEDALNVAANKLISRVVSPGEYFLVRWGGTRKGSGTFYTKPALAGPTVRRTLQPLCYASDGKSLRLPNEIIALKVADIAGGSGSFPVAALRYLTRALYDSLFVHHWLTLRDDGTIEATLAPDARPPWFREAILDLPLTADNPETRILARLRRLIVERCIYAVDLDPLAVELCRLSLWVETMDEKLPFSFLDHKIKVGNALIGCWFDRFQDYPARAWEREGGDANYEHFFHHFREYTVTRGKNKGQREKSGDKWTFALKQHRDQRVKPELRHLIESLGSQQLLGFLKPEEAAALHEKSLRAFEELHNDTREPEKQAKLYDEKFVRDPELQKLRRAFDTWCAVWFWPADKIDIAPTPSNFLNPLAETLAEIERLSEEHHFFHWEIEFPDSFTSERKGFDAIVGNPPWENLQPNPKEYFANIDPLFRTYGRLEALQKVRELFATSAEEENKWLLYNSGFKAFANWVSNAAFPFGLNEADEDANIRWLNSELRKRWRERIGGRRGFVDANHPFQLQMGRVFTYRLFIEMSLQLLTNGGRLGIIVPSAIATDAWATPLRKHLLEKCQWTHLYVFQNEKFVFAEVDHRYKIAVIILGKGGFTEQFLTRFRLGPGNSPTTEELVEDVAQDTRYLIQGIAQVYEFAPKSSAILEICSSRDLAILQRMYASRPRLGDAQAHGWQVTYAVEFMMNSDAKLFPPIATWEKDGYRPDEYGHWLLGDWKALENGGSANSVGTILSRDGTDSIRIEHVKAAALPFYQGIMVNAFDVCAKGWRRGTGLQARWETALPGTKVLEPQYLMSVANYGSANKAIHGCKVVYRRIARTTDTRTMIAAAHHDFPSGDSLFHLKPGPASPGRALALAAIVSSYTYDWQLRCRLGGTNINWFVIEETPLPQPPEALIKWLALATCRLTWTASVHAARWVELFTDYKINQDVGWQRLLAITPHERLQLRAIIDAIVGHLYELSAEDFRWILRDCDHPVERVTNKPFSRTLDPKGFWRVEKDQLPELRHTVLAQVAFADLQRLGLDAFLALNNGEGWLLPESLRLADYGLGHDERAQQPQPVAAALGPRFLRWQLNEDVAASWEECRRHAENIRAIRAKFAPSETAPLELKDEPADEALPISSKKSNDLIPPPQLELL